MWKWLLGSSEANKSLNDADEAREKYLRSCDALSPFQTRPNFDVGPKTSSSNSGFQIRPCNDVWDIGRNSERPKFGL